MTNTDIHSFGAAIEKARTRSQTSQFEWIVVLRTDHPHIPGSYYYAIRGDDKHAWTPGEALLARYVDGDPVAV